MDGLLYGPIGKLVVVILFLIFVGWGIRLLIALTTELVRKLTACRHKEIGKNRVCKKCKKVVCEHPNRDANCVCQDCGHAVHTWLYFPILGRSVCANCGAECTHPEEGLRPIWDDEDKCHPDHSPTYLEKLKCTTCGITIERIDYY